ncbi:MAG: rhodanese-like domain-containing protein, partial [Pyrinomonadaceae bacterium]
DPDCPVCGTHPTVTRLIDYEEFCGLKPPPSIKETEQNVMEEITASELKAKLDAGEDVQIIDVREQHEFDIARIPNSKLIPLAQVVGRADEIDSARYTVVHCKSGGRSAKAIEDLKRAGFSGELANLKGGVTAWSNDVDPGVPKY